MRVNGEKGNRINIPVKASEAIINIDRENVKISMHHDIRTFFRKAVVAVAEAIE